MEADDLGVEIDLAADQAMLLERIDIEGATKHVDTATFGGATQEDDQAPGVDLEIGTASGGQGYRCGAASMRRDGAAAQGNEITL